MSNRLNRAANDDDDMTKMLIVSHYNHQNGHRFKENHQQKKYTTFHLPTAII